jgi:hypothetical protein
MVLVPVPPEYVKLTVGDPVYEKLVRFAQAHTVELLPVMLICPVPNAIDLTLVFDEEKSPKVSVWLESVNVPAVRVKVLEQENDAGTDRSNPTDVVKFATVIADPL